MIATDGKPTIANATGPGRGGVKRFPSHSRKDMASLTPAPPGFKPVGKLQLPPPVRFRDDA